MSDRVRQVLLPIVAVVIVLIILIFAIVGLNTKTPETKITPQSTPVTNQPVSQTKLKWWGVFLKPEDVQPLISAFEAENPGVKIEYQSMLLSAAAADQSAYKTKLTDIVPDTTNSTSPDIFMIDSGWLGAFQSKIKESPINIFTPQSLQSNYLDFIGTDMVRQDKVYGVPLWVDTMALIYNKKMWSAAGLTQPDTDWNRFAVDQAKKLTQTSNGKITVSGFAGANTTNAEFWYEAMNMFLLQNRVSVTDVTTSDATAAIAFYKQFATTNKTWDNTFNTDVAAFLEKKLATYLAPSWRLNDILKYNEAGKLNIDVGVAEVPQLKSSLPDKVNYATYWSNVVNAKSKNTDLAWKFIEFVTSAEKLQKLNQTILANKSSRVGILYPRKDLNATQLTDVNLSVYARSVRDAKTWFLGDETSVRVAYAEALNTASPDLKKLQSVINSSIANSGK